MTSEHQSGETEELELDELLKRMTELLDQVEQADAAVREPMFELLDYLETWHREGITRLATSIPPDALEGAREDPLVANLLDTYLTDEDEGDPQELVEEALEEIRPYVHSHGGEMELVDVSGGVVTLSLMGSCDGCPASSATLTQGVEQILRERWSGFRRLEVAGQETGQQGSGPELLQIQSLKRE